MSTSHITNFILFTSVKYPAHARLQKKNKTKIHSCPVIRDKHEKAISTCSVVYLCASPYKGISWRSAHGVTPIFGIVCLHLLDQPIRHKHL